jgi:tetratricopeptide (TPR) repeat protein
MRTRLRFWLTGGMVLATAHASAFPAGGPRVGQAQSPAAAERYYKLGLAEARVGKNGAAIADFKQSIALDPNPIEPYNALDKIYSKQRQPDADVQLWDGYIQLHPNDGRGYCQRGGTYSWLHDTTRALNDAQKACSLGNQECCGVLRKIRAQQTAGIPPASNQPLKWDRWAMVLFFPALALVALLAWAISAFRQRRGLAPVHNLSRAAGWAAPPELRGPLPRTVTLDTGRAMRFFGDYAVILGLLVIVGPFLFSMHGAAYLFTGWGIAVYEALVVSIFLGASVPRLILFRRAKRLLENGVPMPGVVTAEWQVRRGRHGGHWSARYEFALPPGSRINLGRPHASLPGAADGGANSMGDASGVSAKVTLPWYMKDMLYPGLVMTVLVDGADPKRSIPYPLCPFTVST